MEEAEEYGGKKSGEPAMRTPAMDSNGGSQFSG
jgi:hypothetical protein